MTRLAGRGPASQRRADPAAAAEPISRKHGCRHTQQVPGEDGDSPRDLLTSPPSSVAIWLS